MLGVRIGRRVFDDGLGLTERTLVAIGDDCTLNAGSGIQSHSQEDGAFKSDRTAIGAGCTLGVAAFVHYGVTIGDGAVLAPDSFLMKGEEVAAARALGRKPGHRDASTPSTTCVTSSARRPPGSPVGRTARGRSRGDLKAGPDVGSPARRVSAGWPPPPPWER